MSSQREQMHQRHGEILAEVADMSLVLARKLHGQAMAAETDQEVQAAASAFHRISRSLRQTLALEARLERDRLTDARRAAEERREQVKARKTHVGEVGSRLIWTEAERSDVGQLLVDLKVWCDAEAFHEERFLAAPIETVIERLKRDLGLPLITAKAGTQAEPETIPRQSSA